MHTYYVYILTNASHTVLYVGVTNDIARRIAEHKSGTHDGFTRKYNAHKLVHLEIYPNISDTIAREKQLKAGSRAKKMALIDAGNPAWEEIGV